VNAIFQHGYSIKMILVIQHVTIEGPGILGPFLLSRGFDLHIIDFEKGDSLPVLSDDVEAVISMGGPMNVYEEEAYPFLKDENNFLQEVLKKRIPFLGLCLGAQLICKAASGRVQKGKAKEVGWGEVLLTDMGKNDLLFNDVPVIVPTFQWHGDECILPSGAILLAHNDICEAQCFRIGSCAYGMQFHFEVTADIIESWIDANNDDSFVTEEDTCDIRMRMKKMFIFIEPRAQTVMNNFLAIIQGLKA